AESPPRVLDLAPDRHSRLQCLDDRKRPLGKARARDHEIDSVQEPRVPGTRYAPRPNRQQGPRFDRGLVVHGHRVALLTRQSTNRHPRHPGAEHEQPHEPLPDTEAGGFRLPAVTNSRAPLGWGDDPPNPLHVDVQTPKGSRPSLRTETTGRSRPHPPHTLRLPTSAYPLPASGLRLHPPDPPPPAVHTPHAPSPS